MKIWLRSAVLIIASLFTVYATLLFMYDGMKAEANGYIDHPMVSVYGESVVEIKKNGVNEWSTIAISKQLLQSGDSVRTGDVSEAVIDFQSSQVTVRMNSNTEVVILQTEAGNYYLKLVNGETWVNANVSLSDFVVEAGGKKLSGADAAFDVFAQNSDVIARVVSGGVKIDGNENIVVGEGNQISFAPEVSAAKFDTVWAQNDWYLVNLAKDKQALELAAKDSREAIQKNGAHYSSIDSSDFSFNKLLMGIKSAFIFSDKHQQDLYLSFMSDLIDDGAYYYSVDDKNNGDAAFVFALNFIKGFDGRGLDDLKNLLFDKFRNFKIFDRSRGNVRFAREKTRDLILSMPVYSVLNAGEKLYFARTFLFDAMKEYDYSEANSFIASYFKNIIIIARSSDDGFSKHLEEYNKLAYETIVDNQVFYRVNNFSLKSQLERLIVDLDKKSVAKEKIAFLKNLKEFSLSEKLNVKDAFDISNLLKREAKEYIDSIDGADGKIFESELDKMSDFFGFLADKSYSDSAVYGKTVSERFLAYLNFKRQIYQIEELKKSLSEKEQTVETDFNGIKKTVLDKFAQNGITVEEFGSAEDQDMKHIAIKKAIKDDVVFSAKYNRETGVVSDIKTEDDYEFPLAVDLSKVGAALSSIVSRGERAAAPLPFEETADSIPFSALESSAKALIVDKLAGFNVKVGLNQVYVVNFAVREFRIIGAEIENKKEKITINFDFKEPFTEVVNIELKTQKGVMIYDSGAAVALQDLSVKVAAFAEKVYYEQLDKEIEEAEK